MSEVVFETLQEARKDRFSRVVGGLAVLTALIAAGIGILVAMSSSAAEDSASEAQVHALIAARYSEETLQELDRHLRMIEQRKEHLAIARRLEEESLLAGGRALPAAAREEQRNRTLAASLDRAVADVEYAGDLSTAGDLGPESDPFFPSISRARARELSLRQLARRDAANSDVADWRKLEDSYAAILTLLAVALYLFGFALTDQGRGLRGLFASVGLVLLVAGLLFGPVRALTSPEDAPARAARAYASGYIAAADGKRESLRRAVAFFTRAIEMRPDFAEAYLVRATSRFAAASPQEPGELPSVTTPEALRRGIKDLRMARALGVKTPGVAGSLGFNLFLLGLLERNGSLIDEAQKLNDAVLAADDTNLIAHFNRGVFHLGAGEIGAARRAYLEATQAATEAAEDNPAIQGHLNDVRSSALTDLELVSLYGPFKVVSVVPDIRELIIRSFRAGQEEGAGVASIQRMFASVGPGLLEFGIEESRGLEQNDVVAAEWYRLTPNGLAWTNLAFLSGEYPLLRLADGTLFRPILTTSLSRSCLRPGRYRVDLYFGGNLVGQAEAELGGGFREILDHDTGVVGCIPTSWGPREQEGGHPVRRYLSEDRREGLLLVRLDTTPRAGFKTFGDALAALEPVFRVTAEDRPHGLRFEHRQPYDFLGPSLLGSRFQYRYPGGRMVAAIAIDQDGSTVAALVFGPTDGHFSRDPTGSQVLSSIDLFSPTAVPER